MVEKLDWNIKKTDVGEVRQENNDRRDDNRNGNARSTLNNAHKKALATAGTSPPKFSETNRDGGRTGASRTDAARDSASLKEPPVAGKSGEGVPLKTPPASPKGGGTASAKTGGETFVSPRQAANTASPQSMPPGNLRPQGPPSASTFTRTATHQPQAELAHLLNTKKPVVATPKTDELQPQQQAAQAKVVVPAQPAPQGEQTQASARERKGPEGEVRREKGERSERSGSASGSRALAHTQGSSHGGEKLEAASSGITGGGEEPQWIADEKPVKEIFNVETQRDADLEGVLVRRDWFQKYVLKNPQGSEEAAAVFEKAAALNADPDLERLLALGLAARRNSYGGMHG